MTLRSISSYTYVKDLVEKCAGDEVRGANTTVRIINTFGEDKYKEQQMDQNEIVIDEIPFKDLPFKGWLSLAWAMFWRGMIVMIVSALCGGLIGGVFGGIVGGICAVTDFPFETIKIPLVVISYLLGTLIGFLFLILQLKWFFRANFKNFRIAILNK